MSPYLAIYWESVTDILYSHIKIICHWTMGWTLEIQTKSIRRLVITEKAPTRAFSWLKAATTAFTFKTLLRHYAKLALTHGKWTQNSDTDAIIIRDEQL